MTSRGEALRTAGPTIPATLRTFLDSDGAVLAAMLVALGIFYILPGIFTAVFGLAIYFVLAVYKPHLTPACVAAVASLFYRSREIGPYLFPPAEIVLLASLGAWAAHDGYRLLTGRTTLPGAASPATKQLGLASRLLLAAVGVLRRPFVWAAIAFVVLGVLALLLPPVISRPVALRELRWTIVEPVLFFALLSRFVRTQEDIFRVLAALLVGAAVNGQVGVSQYLFGETWSMEGVGRAIGLYPGATAFGIFMGRALAICATLAIFLPSDEERWRRWRLAFFLLSVPLAGGMIFSFARGAWIGVFVALAAVALLASAKRLLLLLGAGALLSVPVFLVIGAERLVSLFTLSEGTNASRLVIWRSALRVIRDHPIWGIGQDQFLYQPESYGIPHTRFQSVSHPHNFILDTWLRLGILGLLVMLAAIASYFFAGIRVFRRWKGTVMGALALALIAGMADHVVHGLFDMAYFTQDLALTFWLLLGLMAAMIGLTPREKTATAAEG